MPPYITSPICHETGAPNNAFEPTPLCGEQDRADAETAFEVFITADQNVEYQQNLRSTVLEIVVLVASNNRLEILRPLMPKVALVLPTIQPGDLIHITP